MSETYDFVTKLDGLPRLVHSGHDWRNTGLEPTREGTETWARDVWVCARCRRAARAIGHAPVIWSTNGNEIVPCPSRTPFIGPEPEPSPKRIPLQLLFAALVWFFVGLVAAMPYVIAFWTGSILLALSSLAIYLVERHK